MSKKIIVGLASCGISAGGDTVYEKFESLISEQSNDQVELKKSGCIGACFREVIVEIEDENGSTLYGDVTSEIAEKIFENHINNGNAFLENVIKSEDINAEPEFFDKQTRIVLRNTGKINPESIDEYIKNNGYESIKKVLTGMSSEDVRNEMKLSGLRGRGGGGFSTGQKWDFAARENSEKKYMVCNADEGDPGAFMDRSVLEGDPHSVLEGLSIAAYAIGADQGYIYVRAEYPLAIERLNIAIKQARENGYLGENILGSNFSFDIEIKVGAGAFVCGEETALIASIEGKRGMPSNRPPFPAVAGIWGKPTIINNVETLANVPYILLNGADKYNSIGSENSKGTKVFALTGKIKKSGLVEVPMGISLREIIFDIGGGLKEDKKFKAVQLGGPSGGCIPEHLLDTAVDYDSLNKTGAIMGSGGMVVMDENTCMVDLAKFFMGFIKEESCGKCTFCRIGTKRMHEILVRISDGNGVIEDIEKLENLAVQVKDGSLCGLGQTAPNPVITTLRYFKDEYLEHINDKKCKAKVCKPLLTYTIDSDKCTGCTLCAKNCPTDAISGERKEVHLIDQELCINCGNCDSVCNFDAVIVE